MNRHGRSGWNRGYQYVGHGQRVATPNYVHGGVSILVGVVYLLALAALAAVATVKALTRFDRATYRYLVRMFTNNRNPGGNGKW